MEGLVDFSGDVSVVDCTPGLSSFGGGGISLSGLCGSQIWKNFLLSSPFQSVPLYSANNKGSDTMGDQISQLSHLVDG